MSWIEDRIAESSRAEEAEKLILQHAVSVYENLWDQLKQLIEEAKKYKFAIVTNGSPENREVKLTTSTTSRVFHVFLSKDRRTITATGNVDVLFGVGVCPDGVVCLTFKGEPISIQLAAEKVLDRLIFPNLAPR